jgi:superfamily II DNA or RNA helicase
MNASIYIIDKELSIHNQALVLKITDASGRVQTKSIPFSQTFELFKQLAVSGNLYYNDKHLVIDLFGKAEFFYRVSSSGGKPVVQGMIKTGSQEILLSSCDFICGGPPHWFIKGISLKFISTSVSFKDFKNAFEGNPRPVHELVEDAKLDPEAPRVIFSDDSVSIYSQEPVPLPILILKDRTGAFADLWMDYHTEDGKLVAFHQSDEIPSNKRPRDFNSEKGWERDLLETGYMKKMVNSTHYYCPLDQVGKSLAFLLELGWKVLDYHGNRVIPHSKIELAAEETPQTISIKGAVHFEAFQANLSDITGAFNRRERFVQLAPGTVGLLPTNWEGLDLLAEETEVVGEALQIPKSQFGSLLALPMVLSESLKQLKERLMTSKGIEPVFPGQAFRGQLRPYQQEGLNWLSFLYESGFHGILADDMGLGKTVQVLAFLSRLSPTAPVLIILPTSLIFNWQREIERFLPGWHIVVHHGHWRPTKNVALPEQTIILTSYTTLRLDLAVLAEIDYEAVILDEAQAIKNPHTQTFQAVKRLSSRFRLELTGTPIENHLHELWAHFHFLIPDLFGPEESFYAEIQAGLSDLRFLKRIKKKIHPLILRRKKEEVAKDLPEKIEQTVWLQMGDCQRRVYESFLTGIKDSLIQKVTQDGASKHRMEILEAILRLRQICCHPFLVTAHQAEACTDSIKLDALLEDLETIAEEGRKALIYSQFTSMLALIGKALSEKKWPYLYLDGSTTNREKIIGEFQDNPSMPFFLISMKAGGVGLNLTAADYVLLYDPWWNEAVENQAIGRAHRIGRKDTVIAKRYLVAESIEERMMKLKEAKKSLAADLFDEEFEGARLLIEDLLFLLNENNPNLDFIS